MIGLNQDCLGTYIILGLHTVISCLKIEYDYPVHFAVLVGTLILIYFEMNYSKPESIYNPIMAMRFSAMFTFQLDNTKR